ncbi:hypothetical protein CHS0354_023462 [Potamilus streckersoni]|uniref:RNA polymerase II-associated protein 3 n=1 Tax=Potamilus streckersoni TaxID=2493646 RepID=A0AAE0S438_9BIVA|nr:hypothetical protein CHS0354_023462 [Potamilus streckersoni]
MSKISPHEEKLLNLRRQLQENQCEFSEFLKDMDQWENEIKEKEQQLRNKESRDDANLPPVRNSLEKKKKKKIRKESNNPVTNKTKRISSYDYTAWDKFDVDKECAKVEDKEDSSSSDYETDEEWELERKKQQALMEKDKGNDYFNKQDYINAVECYTKGMDLDPTNPVLPANRAMALLKQEKFAAAEIDCTTVLSLDPLYIKAFLRRATARIGLKKLVEAKQDCERVLQLEPQNKKAKQDLEIIDKELCKACFVVQTEQGVTGETGVVKPISKRPDERSNKPLRRIQIEEIGMDEDEERKASICRVKEGQSAVKKKISECDEKMFEHFYIDSPGDIASAMGHVQPERNSNQNFITIKNTSEELTSVISSQKESSSLDNSRMQDADISDAKSGISVERLDLGSHPKVPSVEKDQSKVSMSSPVISPTTSPRELPIPQTSYQFQADFKVLKNNAEAFYRYFRQIPPKNYTSLFGQSLDSDILTNILGIFKNYFISGKEDLYEQMKCLTEVKRFSMTVMFLSKQEKEVVKDLFLYLRGHGEHSSADIDSLSAKYMLR